MWIELCTNTLCCIKTKVAYYIPLGLPRPKLRFGNIIDDKVGKVDALLIFCNYSSEYAL